MESEGVEVSGANDVHSDRPRDTLGSISSTGLTSPDDLTATEERAHAKDIGKNVSFKDTQHHVVTPPSENHPPPFWNKHGRSASTVSYQSISHLRPPAINLEDHSDQDDESGRACWAKHAVVDSWVVVSGATGIGAYVVWNCTVETMNGAPLTIRKRYSEFDHLRENLLRAFPHTAASIPELPRKSVVSRFRPKFLESRGIGLSHFLNCILLHPQMCASPIVKEFIFS